MYSVEASSFTPENQRPEPWVLDICLFEDALHKTSLFADLKDQGCDGKRFVQPASQLQLYEITASKIKGAGVFISTKPEHLGEETSRLNQKKLAIGDPVDSTSLAIVVTGTTPEEFYGVYDAVLVECETLSTLAAYYDVERLESHHFKNTPTRTVSLAERQIYDAYIQDANIE